MKIKLYGFFINSVLMKISPDKELLQELLMDDYFEEAYYQYNVLTLTHFSFHDGNYLSPYDFWKDVKSQNSKYSTRLSHRFIKDMEDYYIE